MNIWSSVGTLTSPPTDMYTGDAPPAMLLPTSGAPLTHGVNINAPILFAFYVGHIELPHLRRLQTLLRLAFVTYFIRKHPGSAVVSGDTVGSGGCPSPSIKPPLDLHDILALLPYIWSWADRPEPQPVVE